MSVENICANANLNFEFLCNEHQEGNNWNFSEEKNLRSIFLFAQFFVKYGILLWGILLSFIRISSGQLRDLLKIEK